MAASFVPAHSADSNPALDKAKELPSVPIYKAQLYTTGKGVPSWIIVGAAPGAGDLSPVDPATCKVLHW